MRKKNDDEDNVRSHLFATTISSGAIVVARFPSVFCFVLFTRRMCAKYMHECRMCGRWPCRTAPAKLSISTDARTRAVVIVVVVIVIIFISKTPNTQSVLSHLRIVFSLLLLIFQSKYFGVNAFARLSTTRSSRNARSCASKSFPYSSLRRGRAIYSCVS